MYKISLYFRFHKLLSSPPTHTHEKKIINKSELITAAPSGSCRTRIFHTSVGVQRSKQNKKKVYFQGWSFDLENFGSSLSLLPAVAWRKLSGWMSSGVYSASQTNELRRWAGFQACKGQKTTIHKSPATTSRSVPTSPKSWRTYTPAPRSSLIITLVAHMEIHLFVLTAQK